MLQTGALPLGYRTIFNYMQQIVKNDSNGNRTRVTAVKGRCLNRLTMEPHSPLRLSITLFPYKRTETTLHYIVLATQYVYYHVFMTFASTFLKFLFKQFLFKQFLLNTVTVRYNSGSPSRKGKIAMRL